MSDFLVVLSSPASEPAGESTLSLGIAFARELQGQQPSSMAYGRGFHAAGFARRDGSGGHIAVDPVTGCWALASGTWFHSSGFASGRERQLVDRWQDAGIEAIARELDGFFVIVLGDPRSRETFVVTDVIGTHCAYLRSEAGVSVIGSSSLVLAAMGRETPDPLGVQEFVRTGSTYEGRTVHRGVSRLLGARIHRFLGPALARTSRHWSHADPPSDRLHGAAAADALQAALARTARRIADLEPRILADLTGGYDTRALLAGFLSAGIRPATTVTGTADSEDVRTAVRVAHAAGVDHRYVPWRSPTSFADLEAGIPFTDGEYDLVEYSSILSVQRTFAHQFGISVSGAAGEMARGRLWLYLLPHIGRRGPIDARLLVSERMRDSRADPLLFPASSRLDIQNHYLGMIARETADLVRLPNTLQSDAVFLSLRMSPWQGRIASSTDRLRRCVAPFLFRSMLEVTHSMTVAARYRSLVVRQMLGRHAPYLARIPLTRGYPPLPFGPRTALAFWPLPVHYAKRFVAKVARTAGVPVSLTPTSGSDGAPRLALWKDEAVRSHLDPGSMRLASLFAPARLERLLEESREPRFEFVGAWNRLLTLEIAFRRLEKARLAVRTHRAHAHSHPETAGDSP